MKSPVLDEINSLLESLSPQGLEEARTFVEFLRRKENAAKGAAWTFNFLENFRDASTLASRDPGGMEIMVADALCGGTTRAALWEHPPVSGSAVIDFLVPVPTGLQGIKLKFSIGIRDGAELPNDRFIAFRVLVNGWKLWSTVKNTHVWEAHEVELPQLGSDVARIEFVTDGLGDNRWNWAVWGEPRLEGDNR
jgi:hypothetical protein